MKRQSILILAAAIFLTTGTSLANMIQWTIESGGIGLVFSGWFVRKRKYTDLR
jgi:hypothetical protein